MAKKPQQRNETTDPQGRDAFVELLFEALNRVTRDQIEELVVLALPTAPSETRENVRAVLEAAFDARADALVDALFSVDVSEAELAKMKGFISSLPERPEQRLRREEGEFFRGNRNRSMSEIHEFLAEQAASYNALGLPVRMCVVCFKKFVPSRRESTGCSPAHQMTIRSRRSTREKVTEASLRRHKQDCQKCAKARRLTDYCYKTRRKLGALSRQPADAMQKANIADDISMEQADRNHNR